MIRSCASRRQCVGPRLHGRAQPFGTRPVLGRLSCRPDELFVRNGHGKVTGDAVRQRQIVTISRRAAASPKPIVST